MMQMSNMLGVDVRDFGNKLFIYSAYDLKLAMTSCDLTIIICVLVHVCTSRCSPVLQSEMLHILDILLHKLQLA